MKLKYGAPLVGLALLGCGSDEVSFQTVETARNQAIENAEFNAKAWRAQAYPDLKIISRGDSTQSPECPQGDGWASIDLVNDQGQTQLELKCSTFSGNIGCLEAGDFKTKRYANQEGRCNSEVPHPLPKIAK